MKHPKPLVYLGASFSMKSSLEQEWLDRTGCKHKCYSFVFVSPGQVLYSKPEEEMLAIDIKNGVRIMMDSGAFSFHQWLRKKKKTKNENTSYQKVEEFRESTIEAYIEFIKEKGDAFDFYVNFDYVKNCSIIYKVQTRLEKAGIRPIPMYHGDDDLDWLRRYIEDGHNYLGLGTIVTHGRKKWVNLQSFYDQVFNLIEKYQTNGRKIKTHGFARTSMAMMFNWPWYSVDSSTWCKSGGMGRILMPTNRGMKNIHLSTGAVSKGMATNMLEDISTKHLEDFVGERGFDFGKLRESRQERDIWNGYISANIHEWKDAFLARRGEKTKWETLL